MNRLELYHGGSVVQIYRIQVFIPAFYLVSIILKKKLSGNVTDLSGDCCGADCIDGTYVCTSTLYQVFEDFPNDGFDYRYNNVDFQCYVGDTNCNIDGGSNTAECNYDGGDCCEDTCICNEYQFCGPCYDCKDPYSQYRNSKFNVFVAMLDLLLRI